MARIVVSGYMVRHPVAGNVATFFHYVLGLRRLGHEVVYLEEKGWPYSCWDPPTGQWVDFPATGLERVRALHAAHCPDVPVVFVDAEQGTVDGMAWADLKDALSACDLLLDVGATCWLEERMLARRRAMVDLDPLFMQVERFGARVLGDYDTHFSVGTNLGAADCTVPTAGFDWIPTAPPVVADLWQAAPPSPDDAATTIANWSGYGGIEHDGVWYGQKDTEFQRLLDLPQRSPMALEVALSGAEAGVRDEFRAAGWAVRDGGDVTGSMEDYRAYIAGSQAELSPAKHAYVTTRSGWISDRTVCYLAAGRPAVVQDTGVHDEIQTGRGLLTFTDADGAVDALEDVARDLRGHSRAARELAARHFDHRVVLPRLVELATAWRPTTAAVR